MVSRCAGPKAELYSTTKIFGRSPASSSAAAMWRSFPSMSIEQTSGSGYSARRTSSAALSRVTKHNRHSTASALAGSNWRACFHLPGSPSTISPPWFSATTSHAVLFWMPSAAPISTKQRLCSCNCRRKTSRMPSSPFWLNADHYHVDGTRGSILREDISAPLPSAMAMRWRSSSRQIRRRSFLNMRWLRPRTSSGVPACSAYRQRDHHAQPHRAADPVVVAEGGKAAIARSLAHGPQLPSEQREGDEQADLERPVQ